LIKNNDNRRHEIKPISKLKKDSAIVGFSLSPKKVENKLLDDLSPGDVYSSKKIKPRGINTRFQSSLKTKKSNIEISNSLNLDLKEI